MSKKLKRKVPKQPRQPKKPFHPAGGHKAQRTKPKGRSG